MNFVVVRDFNYSHDGIATERLKAGTTREIRAELADGLVAAGLIQHAEAQPSQATPVESAEMAQDDLGVDVEQVATPEKRRPGRHPKSRL